MATIPTRISNELFAQAQATGRLSSRSGAQQIDHWARIGRELESSPAINNRDIERVLAGDGAYDSLSEREQAVVRASWEERIDSGIAALNFEEEFTEAGRSWTEADPEGNPVHRP